MITVDTKSGISINEQIVSKIKQLIVIGGLREDEKLPSIRALSKQLVVNPNTVHKAYKVLEEEGFLYSGEKKGFFVKNLEKKLRKKEINNQYEELCNIAKNLMLADEKKETIIIKIMNLEVE